MCVRIYTLFCILLMMFSIPADAQLTVGLVAHWPFNGNATDASGNGYNGTQNNLTYTAGATGLNNTAALFNGTSSYIDVAYNSGLNLTNFSMCAMVKVNGYYTGTCQANAILWRGSQFQPGSYQLMFFDTGSCNVVDTSRNVFVAQLGTLTGGSNISEWAYTPAIVSQKWYCIITTYDGDTSKMYVDGVLKYAYDVPAGTIGSSSEGISIGASRFGPYSTYPYWLKGAIDDLRLYNRVLSPAEISLYCKLANDVSEMNIGDNTISLYPNPNNGNFNITGYASKEIQFEILNSMGQIVYKDLAYPVNSSINKEIILGNIANGIYILRTNSEHKQTNTRFIINR